MTQAQLIQKIKENHLFVSKGDKGDEHGRCEFKETQLSYIFFTSDKAYKIKKSLDIGALGLSSPESRRRFCEQEIELNARDSPNLCLGLCTIYQHPDGTPTLENTGTPAEFAIAMNRFAEDQVFLHMLERNALEEAHLLRLTDAVADTHQTAPKSAEVALYAQTCADSRAAIDVLRETAHGIDAHLVETLSQMFDDALSTYKNLIISRAQTHTKLFQRDLSLDGICWHEGAPAFFDGMPVHKEPQKADTMADLATLVVDLYYLDNQQLAFLVLNRYLKRTDDFDGLPLLRVYCALQAAQRSVRHCLTAPELNNSAASLREVNKARHYAELALLFMRDTPDQRIVAFGGFSGSGKTTLARPVAQRIGAAHIRADAVRKHLFGAPVGQPAPAEAYEAGHQNATYDGLQKRAKKALEAGLSVVIDGVYSSESHRDGLGAFAAAQNLPYTAIWCMAPSLVAHQRLKERLERAGKTHKRLDENHEKQVFVNAGRITWHRLDTVYGKDYVKERVFELLKLSAPDK